MTDRIPLTARVQAGYATAEAGINTVETMMRLYPLAYYTNVVGLGAGLAGIAAALAIVWDALTDPMMGAISDRTRHRFGGRRGYLLPGAGLLALGVLGVFWPPALDGQAAKFAWFLLAYCFLNTGMTVLAVPYHAMAGELTADPHERTRLFGVRFASSNLGAFAAAALPWMFLPANGDSAAGLPAASVAAAAFVVATALVSWVATARVPLPRVPLPAEPLLRAFTVPFGNRAFVPLIAAYVVANIGIGVNAATFLYYYRYVLDLPGSTAQAVLAVFLASFTVSIAAWVALARRFGKRRPLVAGAFVLALGNTVLYSFAPAREPWVVLTFGAVGLGAFVGAVVLLDTLLTDVLDHDLLRTRRMRSGLFFGVWRFSSKMARAVSTLVVGAVLGTAGFVEQSDVQPAAVHAALVVLFGPVVGAFFLGATWLLWRYRFDDHAQARVRALLARRALGERARPSR
jgi:GPH family glycoside/pentoside/hexuronide:cation symporter